MFLHQPFLKAVPVWAAGRECEMNVTCRFTASVSGGTILLRMTCSSVCRVFANGKLVHYGPARGPKYRYRVDEITLSLPDPENLLLFEVAGYNVPNYYLPDQPSFFQCELERDGEILAYTAPRGGMPCDIVTERIQKVQKFCFQRSFAESWHIGKDYADSFFRMTDGKAELCETTPKEYLPRRVPAPTLVPLYADTLLGFGTVTRTPADKYDPRKDNFYMIPKNEKGFQPSEFEDYISRDAYELSLTATEQNARPLSPEESFPICENHFAAVKLPSDLTGFFGMHVRTDRTVKITVLFDELQPDGLSVRYGRASTVNVLPFVLEPGEYDLLSMEPYTMQYINITAEGGDITVSGIHLTEYAAPADNFVSCPTTDPKLAKIWDAAVQTYRQNAVDLFTDCPCRERAGWLCDSFWTARTEYALTGKSVVEKNFLENFLLPERFEYLPDGMIAMCYPSDHTNGNYIPNWAMWLVMQLREYLARTGDREMIDAFRDKVYALFAFLDGYKNGDGLLEKLDKWVFVEWSKASSFVQDVNFPTNMLYAACKEAAGELYHDPELTAEAEAMRETIRRLSFDGQFFTDHLVRNKDGVLENPGDRTEVCQYYAFYLGTATPETYPELWKTLLCDFGPGRAETGKYPEIWEANCFIGYYLRLDMMARHGDLPAVIENIKGYFYNMAVMTGTLWENASPHASLNHGFASHVIVWMLQNKKS